MLKKSSKINIFSFIWTNKSTLALATILMILYAVFENAIPYSMAFIIDNGLREKNLTVVIVIFLILIISGIFITFSQVLRDYFYLDFCSHSLKNIRRITFSYLQNLSMCYYSKTAPGDIISKFSTDLTSVEYALISAPAQFIIPVLSAAITIILLFVMNIPLALMSMLIFPAFFVGPYFLTSRASKTGDVRKKAEAVTISDVQTNISAQPIIKAFNLQRPAIKFFEKRNNLLHRNMLTAFFYSSLVERSSITATIMLQVVLFGIGTLMTFFGHLKIGELVAFQGLFMGLTYNILYCSSFIPKLIQGKVGLNRINTLMEELPKVEDMPAAADLLPFRNEVKFKNVSFGYTPKKLTLHNIDITITKGSSVAFVGGSGCGKSTILNLLMRFYDIDKGTITIDRQDIKQITQNSLRQQLGIVLQDNILFNMSILDNIRLEKLGAANSEVYEAAKKAEIHDFIISLPEGYKTSAGERGSQLSGGQRQRIAIARSLLRGGNILILDEATSALDPVTQKLVDRTIAKIGKSGITIISVTHRLSAVIETDNIYVMDQGKIVEQGNHSELLSQKGVYKHMWDKQSSE
jgi:ATP-binding cassette, subfamily B, bacterial